MSNHYHIVIKLSLDQVDAWTDNEVIKRWPALFNGHVLLQCYVAESAQSTIEHN